MRNFTDKVAVITGAGSGIGRALAIALATEGARLAISDIDERSLRETGHLLPREQGQSYPLDVTSQAAVFAHAEAVRDDFGGAHLLINNAGSALLGSFEHQSLDEMQWLIDLDLWSVIYCTKAFLPIMLSQREGCIVNMSSIAGLMGMPALSSYNMPNSPCGMTESLWSELEGTGVRAMCIHPGGIRTNIDQASRRCATAGRLKRGWTR